MPRARKGGEWAPTALAAVLLAALVAGCSGSDKVANGSIVASLEASGLQILDPDDGTRRAVPGTQGGFEAEWSPDGSWIAFTRMRVVRAEEWEGYVADLYVARPDGAEKRLVARNASAPSWAPDGGAIVFERDVCPGRPCPASRNPYELFVVDLESRDERRLTVNEGYDGAPSWSPDGDWIAFESENGLSLMRPDGSGRRSLTRDWEDGRPSWSPDAKKIVFADYIDVFVVDVDGGTPRRLSANPGPDFDPSWSPDGTMIAYLANHVCAEGGGCTAHEPMHIRVMDADGDGSRALTGDGWSGPSWGPGGLEP